MDTAATIHNSTYRLIRIEPNEDTIHVHIICDRISDETVVQELGTELFTLAERFTEYNHIIYFSRITIFTTAALGKLTSFEAKLNKAGSRLYLVRLRPELIQVFIIAQLNKVFNIAATEMDALAGRLMTPEECDAMSVDPF